jgi:hypothetical protein
LTGYAMSDPCVQMCIHASLEAMNFEIFILSFSLISLIV